MDYFAARWRLAMTRVNVGGVLYNPAFRSAWRSLFVPARTLTGH
jgi:hypothetical protein